MCGICGFTGSPESRVLDNMISSLVHRGPDGKGKVELNNVSLGMRRLAIIDLERGGQPVFNSDKSIVAVFNGEIYNHIELRKELEKKGCRFRSSHSDSEVIVHLYQEFGVSFLNKLNGMFAIALWDKNKDMLLLARDRAGVKPLYFGKFSNRLIFGSEIKSILLHPLVKKSPNFPAIYHFFSFKNIPAPHTAFENIEQLGPGEILTVTGANIRREKWWSLKFHENTELCEEEASTELYNLLEDSVKIRMRSDVEFGAYLSGGVDSSSVVALMSRATNEKIKTFSLVYPNEFPGKMLDQECAQEISSIYDTVHYEVCLQPNEIISSLNDVIKSFDEPYSGVTSTYFLTELISKHVKVAISGDGADELFASYLPHRVAQPLRLLEESHIGEVGDKMSPTRQKTYIDDIENNLHKLLQVGDEAARRAFLLLTTDYKKRSQILTRKMLNLSGNANTEDSIRSLYSMAKTNDSLNRALFVDFQSLLPDQVLAFVDRLSMRHSVEVRTPFLDYRIIEFSAKLSGKLKIRNNQHKYILKKAVERLLPRKIIERPKEGFVLPMNEWLRNELADFAKNTLNEGALKKHGLIKNDYVAKLLAEHINGSKNHGAQLWNLIMFQRWWDIYIP